MSDHPILFSTSMIKALLREIEKSGTGKTQTRRVQAKDVSCAHRIINNGSQPMAVEYDRRWPIRTKYRVGDRLWARETWAHYHTVNHIVHSGGRAFSEVSDGLAGYRADGHDSIDDFRDHVRLMSGCDLEAVEINGDRWRPSIHMPRWASRLTLYVTEVRVERLQDISEADAIAEGLQWCAPGKWAVDRTLPIIGDDIRLVYRDLWEHINAPGAWDANPWVAAYTFVPRIGNIDTLPATLQEAA